MQESPYNSNETEALSREEEKPVRRGVSADLWIGIAMIVVGLIVTVGTYSGSGGGHHYVTIGLFVFGVIRVIRGLFR